MSSPSFSSECGSEAGRSDISYPSTAATTPSDTPLCLGLALAKYNLTESELVQIHDLLIDIAHEAGKMMLDTELEILIGANTKNNSADKVTESDKAIEAMVQRRLGSTYPTFAFLGEETFKAGTKIGNEPTFICDPIDGTLNFTKGVPNSAVSLALSLNKKPIVGVVFNPFGGALYTAIRNRGAYLTKTQTGTRIQLPVRPIPAPMRSLNDCLVAVEWGNQRKGPNWDLRTSVHKTLLTAKEEGGAMVNSIRSNGSAALDFCYVAQGILDVFWEGGVWIWDVAAGWIILEEAGGIVASANPGNWDPTLEGRLYFAVRYAKKEEQKAVVEELWRIMGDRKFVY